RISLDPKRLKEVDCQDLVGESPESLPEGMRRLTDGNSADFIIYGKAVDKPKRGRAKSQSS
ncbi:MAG: hypothetical protein KC964_30890, partial [Candidatus Omnitrophica bacterium]|nr:hypothetical protein [Candidatus Omnitrophota bacterium]